MLEASRRRACFAGRPWSRRPPPRSKRRSGARTMSGTARTPKGGRSDQQVRTVLEVLKALRTVTFESYADGDALVTHAITEIHDVP